MRLTKVKNIKLTKGNLAALAVSDWCKRRKLPSPTPEHYFAKEELGRKWRWDLAWVDAKLAVEINGGGWVNGRHNRASSLEAEYEKLSHGATMGWKVILVTYGMLDRGELWPLLERALKGA
jgi:hypothetical protein